ncbi:ABC transporter permease subunit [Streptomyces varsoviensis]|uniref:ABC transporter permease subunit n=1 Tax=Streptomyces varsoviensis TaxID=67373 RepID=UPI0009963AA2|nr:ABC transporter permease subunit [Streptomyces varsoviensis]
MTTPNQQQAPQEPVPPQGPHAAHAPQQPPAAPAQPYGQPPVPQGPPPQQQWQGQYPGPYENQGQLYGYASPIPVRQANLGDALVSEWTKIKSVRSTMWTLGVMVALVIGIGLLVAVAVGAQGNEVHTPLPSFGFFGVLLGSICVITLGALTMTSEYGTGMIRTTLTACPSRGRVLAAKGLIFFAVAFVITLVTTTLVALMHSALLSGTVTDAADTGAWLRATVGVSLYVATLGLLAMAVGTLLRHSAGAVTVMLGVVLLPLVLGLFMFSESLEKVREFLFLYSIPSQLGGFYGTAVGDEGPTGWTPLWIMLGVTAVVMGGAYASLTKRDV